MLNNIIKGAFLVLVLILTVIVHNVIIDSGLKINFVFVIMYVVNLVAISYFSINAFLIHTQNKEGI